MDYALLLVFTSAAAVGIVAAVVRTWSLHSRLYSLEDRVTIIEGVSQREVKIRAAQERWKKPSRDEEALAHALANPLPVRDARPWYLPPGVPRAYTEK